MVEIEQALVETETGDEPRRPLGFLDPAVRYRSLYERLLANTVLAEPGNYNSCWLWVGALDKGYPRFTYRKPGGGRKTHPQRRSAHRAILEELLQIDFPFDEAGHLCFNPACINPDHLEVQTTAHNLGERRGYAHFNVHACWIPTLFPRLDPLQLIADELWDAPVPTSLALAVAPF